MPYNSPPGPRDTAGRAVEQAAGEMVRHYARAAMLLFTLITVPFRAPFVIASGLKKRRIRVFILERLGNQPIGNSVIRDLTIAWAEQNRRRYPGARHDPKFYRLKSRFESEAASMQKLRGY